ncbi:Pentatricopeptide repeat-containing protein [Striga hermonthica]|uniref:Pentatricopeptide repeat-containing protein n=1 Tax=Striga hermonthica TaxID=68872 RepID=A0A9N7NPX5_STRHE|nr:Pentatricopeptide repeat-containing protein [Striga hermonthica]
MLSGPTSLNRQVLAAVDRCRHLSHLHQLQARLVRLGHGATHFYTFKLIRLCATRLRHIPYSRRLLDAFPSPNAHLYAAVISAYADVSDHASAALLYRDVVRARGPGPGPNHFLLSIALRSWPELLRSHGVELIHAQVVKSGYGGHTAVQTAVLISYSRSVDQMALARKVFDEMPEKNVVSWTALISGYSKAGQAGNAVLLFEETPETIRDTPLWNCIISGCIQNGLFSEALEFFQRMVFEEGSRAKNRPNQGSFVCVLSALGHGGMLELGRCVHGLVYRAVLDSDLFVANGLIDMYGKCGSLDTSRTIFGRLAEPNLTSWNCLINCYALHGGSHEAISIFNDMIEFGKGVKPDGVTFVGLLSACVHGGLVSEGHLYFNMMIEKYEIEPAVEHYGCLVDLLGRAGRFEEAMGVVKGMTKVPPDEVVWGSLLNGCKIHGRADLAELAVKKLFEMDPSNGGYSAILANLYGEMGKWDEAREVRRKLAEGNVSKAAGCSWIEVDGRVHSFYSLDRKHQRKEEIYQVLDCLLDTYRTLFFSYWVV